MALFFLSSCSPLFFPFLCLFPPRGKAATGLTGSRTSQRRRAARKKRDAAERHSKGGRPPGDRGGGRRRPSDAPPRTAY